MSTIVTGLCRGGPAVTDSTPFGTMVCTDGRHLVGIFIVDDPYRTDDSSHYCQFRTMMVGRAWDVAESWVGIRSLSLGFTAGWPKGWHLYNPERIIETKEDT